MALFPTRILVGLDGSPDAALAGRAASDLAGRTDSELHVAHVWRPLPFALQSYTLPPEPENMYEREARKLLDAETERVEAYGATAAQVHFAVGRAAEEMARLAEELRAGLVVVGSRGMNPLQRLVMGSVSEGVVHLVHCPVLVMRGGEGAWPPGRVVAGDDGSEEAGRAAEAAASVAKVYEAGCTLLRALPSVPMRGGMGEIAEGERLDAARSEAERALAARAEELTAILGRAPQRDVVLGDPVASLLAAAERGPQPALVVVGSRGLDAVQRLRLGRVSSKVMRGAHGPVLVLPHAAEG
jgi:nucleotide-binding universal stress UspA family protein